MHPFGSDLPVVKASTSFTLFASLSSSFILSLHTRLDSMACRLLHGLIGPHARGMKIGDEKIRGQYEYVSYSDRDDPRTYFATKAVAVEIVDDVYMHTGLRTALYGHKMPYKPDYNVSENCMSP